MDRVTFDKVVTDQLSRSELLLTSKGRFGAFAFYCWGAGALSLLLIFMDWTFVPTA